MKEIVYLNRDEIIRDFVKSKPEYAGRTLTVSIYDTSYSIKCGKQLLLSVQGTDDNVVFEEARKVYGYCRVSTAKQSIDRQIRNIKAEHPEAVIVTDEYTGTKLDRPGWTKLYKQLKPGDTVVFDQVSRMSRDAEEGFRVYEDLYNLGVNLIFLKEPHINTETYKKAIETGVPLTGTNVDFILEGVNKYLLSLAKEQIRLAFNQAEKEIEDLHQRTREGIETARLAGKQIGGVPGKKLTTKKSIAAKKEIRKYSRDFEGSLTDKDVIKLVGLARGTYYKYKRELREERRDNRG